LSCDSGFAREPAWPRERDARQISVNPRARRRTCDVSLNPLYYDAKLVLMQGEKRRANAIVRPSPLLRDARYRVVEKLLVDGVGVAEGV
jgi:hypothetical protein